MKLFRGWLPRYLKLFFYLKHPTVHMGTLGHRHIECAIVTTNVFYFKKCDVKTPVMLFDFTPLCNLVIAYFKHILNIHPGLVWLHIALKNIFNFNYEKFSKSPCPYRKLSPYRNPWTPLRRMCYS